MKIRIVPLRWTKDLSVHLCIQVPNLNSWVLFKPRLQGWHLNSIQEILNKTSDQKIDVPQDLHPRSYIKFCYWYCHLFNLTIYVYLYTQACLIHFLNIFILFFSKKTKLTARQQENQLDITTWFFHFIFGWMWQTAYQFDINTMISPAGLLWLWHFG